MLTKQQLNTMLSLQNNMNIKVNPEWLTAGYGYLRAAMVESVEAIDHHGWKWWKAQEKDLPQLQMELVDIWHFALSASIIDYKGDIEATATALASQLAENTPHVKFDGQSYSPAGLSLLDNLELMTGLCAAKRFSVPLFMQIVTQSEMTGEELYRQYVGKNVLNFFRQDNGYKAGTYVKTWNGREDNAHLVEVLDSLDMNAPDYADLVYKGLADRYPA
ncbi:MULTISPECIES: dUTP diphosphatase [Marisediminitalea]|jgi:dimeric dUTPase (all-alpha-NTP-PPase superfamily)|uniref:dUTP diphosphatase n=1 Tax=Marisediminitalea TaxID=2662254 RepID=UPI0020CF4F92|nr:dUTP diphosphatase [Marisediminitalea aggregata]MCP3864846.1 dUTP diphosphatase [Aestuariibacter sp.]MCP4235848.1 dUTP diphosphatase [Aestuariibacter sp.]MCP4524875.1 dUTP diphosphatase [Aestuariibacter sp.]MCP9480254.1 dUTP diphosphatase [Marisediminitalea aggregata]|tara:strand:+ start:468 stop:1121 length:654 start_codon:yes stop_codon:yes gene_type:complete